MRGRRFATMCLVFIPLLLATGGVVWATGQSDRSLIEGPALPVPLAID